VDEQAATTRSPHVEEEYMATVGLIGTFDTKRVECEYLAACIRARGAAVLTIDVGPLSDAETDVTAADVAELLACSEDKVKKRMDAGDLAYIVERGSDRRRIPYSWVVEYIHRHKKYAGPLGKRWEV